MGGGDRTEPNLREELEQLRARVEQLEAAESELAALRVRVALLSNNLDIARTVGATVVRERDREWLIRQVAEIVADSNLCRYVWIALLDDGQRVLAHATAGRQARAAELEARLASGDLPPCGRRALQESQALLLRETDDLCASCSLLPGCSRQLLSCQALRSGESTHGILAASFEVDAANDSDTRVLLSGIAEDVGCALRGLQEEARRMELEGALRESEKLYRTLVETSPDAITLTDLQGNFVAANKAAAEMHGVEAVEEFLARGINAFEVIAPEDRVRAAEIMAQTLRTGTCRAIEYTLIRGDGSSFPAELDASLVVDAEGMPKAFVGIVRDRSEHKRAEQERAHMEAQLRHRHKLESIGVLASGVAHEVNNPINVIMNYATLTLREVPFDSAIAEHARQILAESQRVADIVRSLLTFGRKELGNYEHATIADVLCSVLQLVGKTLEDDGIVLTVDVPADLPAVWCQRDQIQQVIMNLVVNAREALNQRYPRPDDNKVLRIYATPLDAEDQHWVRTTVEDHGPGIPEHVLERVFDPFYTSKAAEGGTGLGLSVSHGIIADHGGRLTAESRVGELTRFHMDLRRAES